VVAATYQRPKVQINPSPRQRRCHVCNRWCANVLFCFEKPAAKAGRSLQNERGSAAHVGFGPQPDIVPSATPGRKTLAALGPFLPSRASDLLLDLCRAGLSRRDDWQLHEVVAAAAEMNGRPAAVDRQRPVARIVVQERSVAGELVLHVGELSARAAGID